MGPRASTPAYGHQRHDLAGNLVSAGLHGDANDGDELGGLQLRHAGRSVRLRPADFFGGRGVARGGFNQALHRRGAGWTDQTALHRVCRAREGGGIMLTVLLLVVLICGSTGGEIAISHGAKRTGEPKRMRPRELLLFIGQVMCNGWFLLGIPLMAASFFALLILFSWHQ